MKILVVEDSLLMRRLLCKHLQQWHYEVLEAEDGRQAWELLQAQSVPLVLSDWIMPEMDGLELIRRIRARERPEYVYIILLTSKSEKEDLVRAMEAGADDFLVKPVDPEELRVRVREGERIIRLEHALATQNKQLRDTQAALVQSEKLASLGQLAAGMAHEINNPVAFINNNLTVLRREVQTLMEILQKYQQGRETLAQQAPELAAELAKMEEDYEIDWIQENLPRLFSSSLAGLSRVRDIVKNLRDFARLDEARFDDIDLNAALESTLEIVRHEIKQKDIALKTNFGKLPPVYCCSGKINQVFLNLLVNAIQASSAGGEIEVGTRADDENAVVEVEDHGTGIDPENLPRIFEPFFTTKPVGQGTGLGLAISYGIVRDHGGKIEVDSELGRGSLFRVVLPLSRSRTSEVFETSEVSKEKNP